MTPLDRSRTRDIDTSVTARCWRISASTAGPKNEVTVGACGERFTSRRFGRGGDHVRRDRRSLGIPGLEGIALPLLHGPLDDLLVHGVGERRAEDRGVVLRDRVDLIDHDLDRGSLASAERPFRIIRCHNDQVDLTGLQSRLGLGPILHDVGDMQSGSGERLIVRRLRPGSSLDAGTTTIVSSCRRMPLKPSPKTAMIRNGPRIRLTMAPGRRRVSTSSLPTNASSRQMMRRMTRIRRPALPRDRLAVLRTVPARRGSRRPRRTKGAPRPPRRRRRRQR